MNEIRLPRLHATGRPDDCPVAWRGGRLIGWREYHGRVHRLSHLLAERPGRRWLLACADPLGFAIGLFALWHAGKVAVVPPSLRPATVADMACLVDGQLEECLAGLGDAPDADWSRAPLHALDAAQVRLELHTSGSTGEPKPVAKSLAQLDHEVAVLERLWGQRAAPALATVPHHHIYGLLFRLLWPLAAGRPFDTETCATPEELLARLDALGPATVISSPSQLARMPELIDLSRLRARATTLFSSGGPLPAEAAARFHAALGEAPLEIYGSTETGGIAWRRQRHGDDAWTPQPGVVLSQGEDGALALSSPFLPDTRPAITGDAVQLLPDGRFHLLGRLDRIVKIEEKRLSLPELEQRLRAHPWIAEAAALVLNGRRQRVGAVLVPTAEGRAQLAGIGRHAVARQLRQHLGQWFDAVLLPRLWRYPVALPYNERGKLARADLLRLFADPHHD